MRFVHALVPFVFPRQVGTMIQEYPSKFFPTESGISGCVTRPTTTIGMASATGASIYGQVVTQDCI
jgi:hypothetical protein